jgi:hypothetical protein
MVLSFSAFRVGVPNGRASLFPHVSEGSVGEANARSFREKVRYCSNMQV